MCSPNMQPGGLTALFAFCAHIPVISWSSLRSSPPSNLFFLAGIEYFVPRSLCWNFLLRKISSSPSASIEHETFVRKLFPQTGQNIRVMSGVSLKQAAHLRTFDVSLVIVRPSTATSLKFICRITFWRAKSVVTHPLTEITFLTGFDLFLTLVSFSLSKHFSKSPLLRRSATFSEDIHGVSSSSSSSSKFEFSLSEDFSEI
mmetsp:Transcript_6480/g.9755  ORF Transcript_6480/g.9755 Transcript_6480/m.9755 type:complete len:201 (+) Transcript_6480:183-785(+)